MSEVKVSSDDNSSIFSSDEESVMEVVKFKGKACPVGLDMSEHYLMFTLTVSSVTPFTDYQLAGIRAKLASRKFCCVALELHKNGSRHLHGVVSGTKNATGLTRVFVVLYRNLEIPYVKGVSVKVKTVTNMDGALYYCTKESIGGELFLLRGWKRTWITERYRIHLLKMPSKILMKNFTILQRSTAVPTIINWIKAHGLVPAHGCANWWGDIMVSMIEDGYLFNGISGQLRCISTEILIHMGCLRSDSHRRCLMMCGLVWD